MLLNKNNLNLAEYCDKTNIKPEISGIYITPDETVATDGYVMVIVSTPKLDIKDFPTDSTAPFTPKQVRAIIPANLAKSVANKLQTNTNLPILENAVIKNFKNEEMITFLSTNLEIQEETKGQVIKGTYPDYKKILPTGTPKAQFTVSYEYLKSAITALAKTAKNDKSIKIELYGENNPIVLKSSNDLQTTIALVMPIKVKE